MLNLPIIITRSSEPLIIIKRKCMVPSTDVQPSPFSKGKVECPFFVLECSEAIFVFLTIIMTVSLMGSNINKFIYLVYQ